MLRNSIGWPYWDKEKKESFNIQNHPLIEGFKIQTNSGEDNNDFDVISNKWEKLEPLSLTYHYTPDEINEFYKLGEINSDVVAKKLGEYEKNQELLNNKIDSLWWEWWVWTYESMHWWHHISNLFPKSLKLDSKSSEYKTSERNSIYQDTIVHIWDYWETSIFIGEGTTYWSLNMSWYSDNVLIFALNKENRFMGKIWTELGECNFKLYNYKGHLLLANSIERFFNGNKMTYLSVIASPEGELSEKFFIPSKVKLTWVSDVQSETKEKTDISLEDNL